jgi:hypothetical protein
MLSGPKTLSGGWLRVTRQYWGECRVRSIRFVLVSVAVAFFICPPPINEFLNSNRRAKAKQLDVGIANTLVSKGAVRLATKLERAVSCANERKKLVAGLFLTESTQHGGRYCG